MPYTTCKLVGFEILSQLLTRFVAANQAAREREGREPVVLLSRTAIVLSSGLLAGALAAVVSQPFDLLLTRVCGSTSVSAVTDCVLPGIASQLQYLRSLGPAAFTGLAPRLGMVSVMTSCQFFLYDSLRTSLNCAPPAAYAKAVK